MADGAAGRGLLLGSRVPPLGPVSVREGPLGGRPCVPLPRAPARTSPRSALSRAVSEGPRPCPRTALKALAQSPCSPLQGVTVLVGGVVVVPRGPADQTGARCPSVVSGPGRPGARVQQPAGPGD